MTITAPQSMNIHMKPKKPSKKPLKKPLKKLPQKTIIITTIMTIPAITKLPPTIHMTTIPDILTGNTSLPPTGTANLMTPNHITNLYS